MENIIESENPINDSGLMYRKQYLVLDRTMMEALPLEWQRRMVQLLEEVGEHFDYSSEEWEDLEYLVKPRGENGKFIESPWGGYRHPNREYIESVRKNKTNQSE